MSNKKSTTHTSGSIVPRATVPSAAPWPPPSGGSEVTTINDARHACLDTLRCAVTNLEAALVRIRSKADTEGIDASWSEWSDVLRYGQSVWAAEHRLAALKRIARSLDGI